MQIFNLKINDGNNLSGSQTEKNQECANREYEKGVKRGRRPQLLKRGVYGASWQHTETHTNDIKSHKTGYGPNHKHICSMYAFEQLKIKVGWLDIL